MGTYEDKRADGCIMVPVLLVRFLPPPVSLISCHHEYFSSFEEIGLWFVSHQINTDGYYAQGTLAHIDA